MKIIYFFLLSILTLNGIYCQSENDNNLSWESNIGSVTSIEPVKSDAWKVTICVNAVFVEACFEVECHCTSHAAFCGAKCNFVYGKPVPTNITVPDLVTQIEKHNNMITGTLKSIELSDSDIIEFEGSKFRIKIGNYKLNESRTEFEQIEIEKVE